MNLHREYLASAKPVDLEVRVTTPWGRGERAFEFELDSPSGIVPMHHKRICGPTIHTPDAFRKELMEQVACLGRGQDADGKKLRAEDRLPEMVAIGHDLYRKLFPRELRDILTGVRSSVSTLVITSDEPWIPWEVLHPAEDEDDDFLCMSFEMSRWLTGEASLAPRKHVGRILGLQAGAGAKLASTVLEVGLLESLCRDESGARGLFPPSVTAQDLSRILEDESFDLIHFAGHSRGQHPARFGSASIALGDRSFRPRSILPAAERRLRASRPIVFLNSCHASQTGQDLTELDGWAPHWVRQCRCSAFLGPSWAVDDSHAMYFAETFYAELFAGKSLGEAVRISRTVLRDLAPGDLTWLAYCLYGHPGAQITLGPPHSSGERADLPNAPEEPSPSVTTIRRPRAVSTLRNRAPATRWQHAALRVAPLIVAMVLLVVFRQEIKARFFDPAPPVETGTKGPTEPTTEITEIEAPPVVPGMEGPIEPPLQVEPDTSGPTGPPPEQAPPVRQEPPLSLLPVETGKVAIIALDSATDSPAPDIARAIRSILNQQVKSIRASVPQATASLLGLLESRDPSVLPADGRAPWGAEFLLFVRASKEDLPQRVPHIQGVALTLEVEIQSTQSGEVWTAGLKTANGAGVSHDQALLQAAERCLRETVSILNQGVQP